LTKCNVLQENDSSYNTATRERAAFFYATREHIHA